MTPLNNFSAVSLTPVINFRFFGYFSPEKNVTAGVNDTTDKLFAGVKDTANKLFTGVKDTADKFFTNDKLY